MADVTLTLGANTREIESAINRLSKKKVNLGGINSKNFTVPLGRIQGQLGEFNKSLQASNARVLAFGASAGAIFAVQQAFSSLVRSTIDVEKKLAEINVVLGTSQKSLKSFGNELFNAAANAGMGFDAAAEAATEFSRQGLGLEKTLQRVNDALVLSRLTGLSVADSVNAITAAINGYNLSLKEQENLTSRIIAVDQAFAVSGADIAEAMRRVASTAQGAGVSLNELISIVTAAQQKTARGGAVIGNSFKTIFTRLQRPRTLEALDQLGIKVKDAQGAMLPAMQVLSNLAKQFDGLTHAQKSNVAQLVGGVFQINVLKAAIGDLSSEYSIYGNALEIANAATDEANQRNAELNKTMSAQLNELVQNVTRVAAAFGELTIGPALEKIIGGLNTLFAATPEGEAEGMGSKIGKGILRGIGNVLSGPGLLMLGVGLFKLFQFLGKQAKDAVSTIMQMGKATEKRMALENKVLETLQQEPAILDKIVKGEMSISKLHDEILKDISNENTLLKAQEQIAKNIAASLAQRTTLQQSGSGTALVPKRRSGGYIPNYADQLEMERREAMRRGASPRVRGYYDPKVKIKGKRGAIVNTEEDIIHNFRGGESAVLPRYNKGVVGPKPKGGVSHKGYKKLLLPEKGFGVISVGGSPSVTEATGGLELSPAVLKSAGFKNAQMGISVMNLDHFRPMELLKGGLESSGSFKQMIQKPLGDAILEISKKLLGATPDEIPNPTKVGDLVTRDKAAYPQMAGRIFEKALSGAIEDPSADFDKSGTSRWDFTKASFNNRKTAVKSMFGKTQGGRLLDTNKIDSKLDVSSDAYKKSMAKKLSPELIAKYGKQLGPYSGSVKAKAAGYIPNFASGLGAAIGREHDAGIPYNQMRVHTAADGHPIAVTNKKDEPNGLKDVRRMNRGYIPNFASSFTEPISAEGAANIRDKAAKARAAKFESAANRAGQVGIAFAMLAPAIGNMTGAGEKMSGTINEAGTAVALGATVFSMMPTKMGAIIGGAIAAAGALNAFAKFLATKHLEKFIQAAEKGKEDLEKFNASSQAAATAMSNYDAELKKAQPDAKRLLSFQRAYGKALAELPSALRRQVLSSGSLADAQEALAKAQMEQVRLQKGREAAGQVASTMDKQAGFTNAYNVSDESQALGVGALIGAGIGSFLGPYGIVLGGIIGGAIGKKFGQASKEATVFGSGDDSIDLKGFSQDVAKSIDFEQLSDDVSNGLDLMAMSGKELGKNLTSTYGASVELGQMMAKLGDDDAAVLTNQLQILAEDAKRAREEAEALSNLMEQQATVMAQLNAAIQQNRETLDSWLQTLTAVTKAREAFDMAQDKASREYWTAAAKSVRDLNKVFLTDEGNAEAASQMKDASVNNKLLDNLGKIQMKTRDGMIAAVEKTGGEAGLGDQVLLDILKVQEDAVKNGLSNVEVLEQIKQIDDGTNGKLGENAALMAQMTGLMDTQNSEMKIANLTAETQLQINKMQLAAQKKQIQISKDIKTMGGLNTFMDPEGAGKKKAEDFEKGLEGFGVGAARGDDMQQGRGAVQLLRSAMDAGVDIMGPDGAAFKQQAIDANAGFLRNTFTDRASRLNQQADQLDAVGRGGEAQQLRDQASGYMSQAGRADEIAENQVMAEFKKAKMPENIAEIKDIDEKLLTAQENSMKNRQKDFENALNAAQITDATTQVANHLAVQTALLKEKEALEVQQKAEKEVKAAEEAKTTADAKVEQKRGALFGQALSDTQWFEGAEREALSSVLGMERDDDLSNTKSSKGMDKFIQAVMKGSGGQITNMSQLIGMDDAELKRLYDKGRGDVKGGQLGLEDVENLNEFLNEAFMNTDDNKATQAYVNSLDDMAKAFDESERIDEELKKLTASLATANAALLQAQGGAANAQAVAAALPATPAIATPGGPAAGLPTAGGGPALPAGSPTFDSQGRPVAGGAGGVGGAGGGGNTTYDSQGRPEAGGGATPTPEEAPEAENPMADLATNVGSLVERLDQGINAFHNINFETPLPLVVTVQGEVSNLITPEDIAKIENAVIAKLSSSRPQNNGANTAANVNPGQVATTQNV